MAITPATVSGPRGLSSGRMRWIRDASMPSGMFAREVMPAFGSC